MLRKVATGMPIAHTSLGRGVTNRGFCHIPKPCVCSFAQSPRFSCWFWRLQVWPQRLSTRHKWGRRGHRYALVSINYGLPRVVIRNSLPCCARPLQTAKPHCPPSLWRRQARYSMLPNLGQESVLASSSASTDVSILLSSFRARARRKIAPFSTPYAHGDIVPRCATVPPPTPKPRLSFPFASRTFAIK